MSDLTPVILESPYAGNKQSELARNVRYARFCMKDCLRRGEAPFASHLLYTQDSVLDDDHSHERLLGINAGLSWCGKAEKTVVYIDFGISSGMEKGIEYAKSIGKKIEYRHLPKESLDKVQLKNLYT